MSGEIPIHPGSGNVFADLGLPEAGRVLAASGRAARGLQLYRDRAVAEERIYQAIRLLRDVLAMSDEVRGPFKPLLETIHGLERLAEEVAGVGGGDAADAEIGPSEADGTTSAMPEAFRERLTWDADVSESSPVVKGTWVTVSHVISLVVDGWTWADILRAHPELTEDDIRACLAYTVAEEDDR